MTTDWRDARATFGIAAVTVFVSLALLLFGDLGAAAMGAGFVPLRLAGVTLPDGLGIVVPVALTPLSATLVHAGFLHLLFNLVMLVYCGRPLEKAVGSLPFAGLYIAGAYAAAAVQWAIAPDSVVPMIGASGAISAVVGAFALLFSKRRARSIGPVPADLVHIAWLAAAWIGMQVLIGATGAGDMTIAIGAHIGGFLAGLALARPLLLWRYRDA